MTFVTVHKKISAKIKFFVVFVMLAVGGVSLALLPTISEPEIVYGQGSQTFINSGTFTVPTYATMTVRVWGGGGGGGSGSGTNGSDGGLSRFNSGTPVIGNGGSGSTRSGGTASGGDTNLTGQEGFTPNSSSDSDSGPGVSCSASGGGGKGGAGGGYLVVAKGGVGGNGGSVSVGASEPNDYEEDMTPGGGGSVPGGAGGGGGWGQSGASTEEVSCDAGGGSGGGGGGYAEKVFVAGDLTPGASISVTVGSGGTGGSGSGYSGGNGARGEVRITWTVPTNPPAPDPMTFGTSPDDVSSASIDMIATAATASNTDATTTIILTSGTSWTVPDDWNDNRNIVEVIGGGGGGASNSSGAGGGGGGAYSALTQIDLTPGGSVSYSIGSGGGAGTAGGDTYFNGASCGAASVCAEGGSAGSGTTGGNGGLATNGVGSVTRDGGDGGDGDTSGVDSSGGGGGAAGPYGNGGDGGRGDTTALGSEAHGGGGGANNNGTSYPNGAGQNGSSNGGVGGNNWMNTGGGSSGAGSDGGDGSDGGGGGGGDEGAYDGGDGGNGSEWGTAGAGGGGGGGDDDNSALGGNGGSYGGGGGGGSTGGSGAQGVVVISYVPAVEYNFTAVTGSCGADIGTGGTNSGWQLSASYTDTGLQTNKCYAYAVSSRNGADYTTSSSSASSAYTAAAVPGAPAVSNVSNFTFDISNDANGNPSSNPITYFAVQLNNSSPNDATWEDQYVDASGDPSASAVWLTDAQIDGLSVTGLSQNTYYEVQVKARNADNDETSFSSVTSTTTLNDTTAPTPDPMTFATSPDDASISSIDMLADTATDAISTPVEYNFRVGAGTCGANYGTGGTNSGWQESTSYTDTGLQTNKCYGYSVSARDAVGNETGRSATATVYTAAATPGAPTIESDSPTTISLTNNENGNPTANPSTEFAVQASSSDATWDTKYVDSNGDPSDTAVWLSDSVIDALTMQGLTGLTTYDIRVKARNNDNEETSFSSYSSVSTLDDNAPTPNNPSFTSEPDGTSNSTIAMTSVTASDDDPPIEYNFTAVAGSCGADIGTGGTNSGWQTSTSYTDTGLQTNKCYGYEIAIRDSLGNTTATSAASVAYTEANTPGKPTLGSVSTSTVAVTNDENGNPTSNPATTFALFVSNSEPTDATWHQKYVDASGDPSDTAVWLTDAQLTGFVVRGLAGGTRYTFIIKARNGDNDETSFGPGAQTQTGVNQAEKVLRLLPGTRLRSSVILQ